MNDQLKIEKLELQQINYLIDGFKKWYTKNNSEINTYPRVIKLKKPTSMKEINYLEIKITSNVPGRNYLQK